MSKQLPKPVRRVERYALFLYAIGVFSKEDLKDMQEKVKRYGRGMGEG